MPMVEKSSRCRLGEGPKPVEQSNTIAKLKAYKTGRYQEHDTEREDLSAQNRPANALDGGIATPQLGAPPEYARRRQIYAG